MRPLDPAEVRSILAVKLSSLGDVVHVTPCLRALRRHFPQARLTLAVDAPFADVVRHNLHLDEIISPAGRPGRWGRLVGIRQVLAGRPRFDLAIDFQGNWRSALWVYLSRARVKAGRGTGRPGWAVRVRFDPTMHAVPFCAGILEALGLPVPDLTPEVFPDPAADERVRQLLGRAGLPARGFLLVNPFSRWASKAWPAERYAELITRVRGERPVPVVVTGGPGETGQGRALVGRLLSGAVLDLVGRLSLAESIALFGRAGLMVTGDSGPMHIAAALGTRVVALFGPTLPERTGPWGQLGAVIQARRPRKHRAYRSDSTGKYIRAIPVETVVRAVLSALDRPEPGTAPAA